MSHNNGIDLRLTNTERKSARDQVRQARAHLNAKCSLSTSKKQKVESVCVQMKMRSQYNAN